MRSIIPPAEYVSTDSPSGFQFHLTGYVLVNRGRASRGPFHCGVAMRRVIVYVDGFNLYHAIDGLRQPHLKWVNLHALGQELLRKNETLVVVKYFSAYATWKPAQYARHRQYTKALEHAGVSVNMSKFKKKDRTCLRCNIKWTEHEEKETDVKVAISLVADAYEDAFDRAIVVSADSDLAPPISLVRSKFPQKEVTVAAPPGRISVSRDLSPSIEVTKGRIARALLHASANAPDGTMFYTRPVEYPPPPPAAPKPETT